VQRCETNKQRCNECLRYHWRKNWRWCLPQDNEFLFDISSTKKERWKLLEEYRNCSAPRWTDYTDWRSGICWSVTRRRASADDVRLARTSSTFMINLF